MAETFDETIVVAAFAKMVRGEQLSLSDAERVYRVFLNRKPAALIDSANQELVAQFISQLQNGVQQVIMQ